MLNQAGYSMAIKKEDHKENETDLFHLPEN